MYGEPEADEVFVIEEITTTEPDPAVGGPPEPADAPLPNDWVEIKINPDGTRVRKEVETDEDGNTIL